MPDGDDALHTGRESDARNPDEGGHDSTGLAAARALRRTRRRHRLVDQEWFELLYRVYLAAFLGGGAILFVSGLVSDAPLDTDGVADVVAHGPAVLGVLAVVCVALGLRSGAQGGPIALEDADVRHVLLAPVSHERILLHPAVQRLRTMGFAGALAGGVAGQLAGRRLPGSEAAWAVSGAVFGAACGVLLVATALIAHGLHLPRWSATLIGGALVAWQVAAAADPGQRSIVGPADGLGETALWNLATLTVDVLSIIGVALIVVASLTVLSRLSLEQLSRRSALVSQLRFAVTLQDMRTVMLLRRQLAQEHPRSRPLVRLGGSTARRGSPRTSPTWRRGWQGLFRFPASRVLRMLLLVAIAAVSQVIAWRGTSPAIVASGIALFVLGLEALEPLSQEVDQADRTDAIPHVRGALHVRLLAPSAVVGVVIAVIGAAIGWTFEPRVSAIPVVAVLAVASVLGGLAGAALNIVGGAPDPLAATTERNFMPPEVAGTTTLVKAVWPVALSIGASAPVLLARAAIDSGSTALAGAARGALLSSLIIAGVAAWVRFRDEAKAWIRASAEQGTAMRMDAKATRAS
jgi:hypothetical protein